MTAPIGEIVSSRLRDIPDFPVAGVVFKDFTPLLSDGPALRAVVQDISRRYAGEVDVIVGIEARGLILGAAVAYELGVGFVPVRKAGKLPWQVIREEYSLEYGSDKLEVHRDAIFPGERILVIDDVLATGGTAAATVRLVEALDGIVVGIGVLIELEDLGGRARLDGRRVESLARY